MPPRIESYAVKQMTLKEARESRGYTQEELAQLADVDQGSISRMEAGLRPNPSNDTVKRLEEALKLRRGTLTFDHAEAASA